MIKTPIIDEIARIRNARNGLAGLDSTGKIEVELYDTELAAIAGLTSAADKLPYFDGAGSADLADLTTAGRALIDDANAAAQRTTLGLGTIATQNANAVAITGGSVAGITDLPVADGGTGSSTASAACSALGAEQTANKDQNSGYAGLNSASRMTKGMDTSDDVIIDTTGRGLVLKDTAGHYWRISVSILGVMSTSDLGTSKP